MPGGVGEARASLGLYPIRCGGGRKPDQSGLHVPRDPGASRRPYSTASSRSWRLVAKGAVRSARVRILKALAREHSPRLPGYAFMCRWFVNVPWLLGIDVVRM